MTNIQNILVFQQNGSGEKKVEGIKKHGKNRFSIEIISIDKSLPAVIDDAAEYIPQDISADVVLDFLEHPDISYDLFAVCRSKNIPVVASGKKVRAKDIFTPPT
jgi:hypothetical protein